MHRKVKVLWVGGVVKAIGRWRLVKLHDSYFAYNKIISQDYACNLECGLELAFPYLNPLTYFAKNFVKIASFNDF